MIVEGTILMGFFAEIHLRHIGEEADEVAKDGLSRLYTTELGDSWEGEEYGIPSKLTRMIDGLHVVSHVQLGQAFEL